MENKAGLSSVEDMVMVIMRGHNLKGHLKSFPESLSVLGELMLVSTYADFDIPEVQPERGFMFFRHPKTFRAAVEKVANRVFKTFNIAHTNMDKIRLLSQDIVKNLKSALRIFFKGSLDEVTFFLPIALTSLKKSTDDCLQYAKSMEDEIDQLMSLSGELLECFCYLKSGLSRYVNFDLENSNQEQATENKKQKKSELVKELDHAKSEITTIVKKNKEDINLKMAATEKNLQDLTSESINNDVKLLIAPYIELDHFLVPLSSLVSLLGKQIMLAARMKVTIPWKSHSYKTQDEPFPSAVVINCVLKAFDKVLFNVKKIKEACIELKQNDDQELQLRSMKNMTDDCLRFTRNLNTTAEQVMAVTGELTEVSVQKTALNNVVRSIAELREQWTILAQFFQMTNNIIDICLNKSVKKLEEQIEVAKDRSLSGSKAVNEEIDGSVLEVIKVAHIVRVASSCYVEVYESHVLNRVTEIKGLLKLNPKSDEAKMKDVVDKLSYEEELVCDEIQHLVKKNTRDLDLEIQSKLKMLSEEMSELSLNKKIPQVELSDRHIFSLSKRITNSSTCKELGLSLGLDGSTIDSILYDHRNDEIASTANTMLSKWLLRYEDRKVACGDLITALRKCALQGLIPEVFV